MSDWSEKMKESADEAKIIAIDSFALLSGELAKSGSELLASNQKKTESILNMLLRGDISKSQAESMLKDMGDILKLNLLKEEIRVKVAGQKFLSAIGTLIDNKFLL